MYKALLLIPIYEPYAGGGGQYFPLLRNRIMTKCDFSQIDVLTEYHPERPLLEDTEIGRIYRILPRRDSKSGKSNIYFVSSFILSYFIMFFATIFLVVREKYNILLFTRYYRRFFYLYLYFLKRSTNIKIVCDLRATIDDITVYRGLDVCELVICNSLAVFEQAQAVPSIKKKCVLVTNPINFIEPNERFKENFLTLVNDHKVPQKYLLFVGQLLERKSIWEVLKAYHHAKLRISGVGLVIIGRNMMDNGILKYIDDTGAIYLGEQPRDVVAWFLRGSEMVLQPSKVEGIPRVSLEALYLKRKVLLARCVPEFVTSDPSYVAFDLGTKELSKLMTDCLVRRDLPIYDVSVHKVENSIPKYREAFGSVLDVSKKYFY